MNRNDRALVAYTASVAALSPSHFASGQGRLAASLAPAAAVTVGLFLAMMGLIRTDEIVLEKKPDRILTAVTPKVEADPFVEPTKLIEIPDVTELPPPPPVQRPEVRDGGIPMPVVGQVPATLPGKLTDFIRPVAQPIGERVPVPIRPPVPAYPRDMAARGISGSCTVHFSLSARGLPFDIVAACSHPGFENEARRAVSRTEFLPEIRDGQPMESHKLVYPLEFTLQ